MERTDARSDFISFYLELIPEAIVVKMLVLSAVSGLGVRGGGTSTKENPKHTKPKTQQPPCHSNSEFKCL